MADKAADLHTLAPRLSYVEDLATWLKDNRSEGSGTTDEALWKATLTGAETSGSWSSEPWTQTDLIYGPDSPNEMSLHQTLFGNNAADAMKMQDGKGFYAWLFPGDETRWQNGPDQSGAHLANEVFGLPDSGYVHALRDASLSLMESIFKNPSYVGDYTIIDRIETQTADLEELASNVEDAFSDLQTEIEAGFASINTQLDAIRARLTVLESA